MINSLNCYAALRRVIAEEFKNNSDPDKNFLKVCDMYKGELEEGAEWKASLPALFIELYREDVTRFAGAVAHQNELTFNLFLADKNHEEPSVLEHMEEIKSFLNGKLLNAAGDGDPAKWCKVIYEGSHFHAYIRGLGAAYIMTFKAIIN